MAFTSAPVSDTHNTKRIPVAGSQFIVTNESTQFPATLNYIDCFPLSEPQWGTEPKRRIHKRDAYKTLATLTLSATTNATIGPSQVLFSTNKTPQSGLIYFIASEPGSVGRAYKVTMPPGVATTITALGTTAQIYQTGTTARNANQEFCLCWVGGNKIAIYNETLSSFAESAITPTINGQSGIVFIDGYLYGVDDTTRNRIYNSAAGGALTTWNTTDFTNAEIFPDGIAFIAKHHNYLVAFGSQSIEFFYDAGNAVGSPLSRQETYASKVGFVSLISNILRNNNKGISVVGDDIYFIGKNEANQMGLYRIRNFRVEEINNQYLQNVLAYPPSSPNSIETILVNNNPNIRITVQNFGSQTISNTAVMYLPQEDTWWQMTNADFTTNELLTTNTIFDNSFVDVNFTVRPVYFQFAYASTTLLMKTEDFESVVSNTATIYTPIIDMGTNFYSHFARVDAIGDLGNNSITLSYAPNPRYLNYVSCGSKTPSAGMTENVSWYNLGAFRRPSLKWDFSGAGPCIFEATEVTYNEGSA